MKKNLLLLLLAFMSVVTFGQITAPHTESFNSTFLPAGWSLSATSGGPFIFTNNPPFGWNQTGCTGIPADNTGNLGNYAAMDHSGADVGVVLEMDSVDVTALTVPYLSFYYYMCGTGYTPINPTYVESWDGTSWNVIMTLGATNGWEVQETLLTGLTYTGSWLKLRFRAESGGSGSDFYGDVAIDDVSIVEAPSCPNPENLMMTASTSTTVDLSWTSAGAANYILEYGPVGFSIGSGTTIVGTGTTATITSLNPITEYDWYLIDSCAVGDISDTVGPANFQTACVGPLAGVYTIGSLPADDFSSFSGAALALNTCGISAAVTFNVSAGTYTESMDLNSIVGANATNTITFNGASAATTTITSAGGINNATIGLDSTDYITLKNLTIENTKLAQDAWGVWLSHGANFNTIDSCIITLPVNTTFDRAGIVSSGSNASASTSADNADNLIISNNTITGAYYGIRLNGAFAFADWDNTITIQNNSIEAYLASIYLNNISNVLVDENTLTTDGANTGADGLYCFNIANFYFTKNNINVPDYGIYVSDGNFNGDGAPVGRSTIINNMVYSYDNGSTFGRTAAYFDDFEFTDIFHNTFSGYTAGMRVGDAVDLDVRNNIFASSSTSATDYAYEDIQGLTSGYLAFDYNIFWGAGTNLFDFGPSYVDLAAFQAAQPTFNVNSYEGDPGFVSPSDLHVIGILANDVADNTVSVSTDIDGDARPLAPSTTKDIGADEFFLPPDDAGVLSLVTPSAPLCVSTSDIIVELKNFGTIALTSATIDWTMNGVAQTAYSWTGSIPVGGSSNVTIATAASVPAGLSVDFTFNSSLPNGVADLNITNDSASTTLVAGLNGVYTIDPAMAASATNYISFTSAVADLNNLGVCGPVTFNAAAGSFSESIEINSFFGASTANLVTFNGASTTLTSTGAINNATITFDGASYVTFKNMTIENSKVATDAWAIWLTGGSNSITIDSCTVSITDNTTFDRAAILSSGSNTGAFSDGDNADNFTVSNSVISGGYYGIYLNGGVNFADWDTAINIVNNDIDAYYYGIYLDNINGLLIDNNDIDTDPANTFADGIYCFDLMNFDITNNFVNVKDYGLYITDGNWSGDGTPTGRSSIVNNMIYSETDYAANFDDFEFTDVFHNTFSGFTAGMRVNDAIDLDVRNNIFVSTSTSGADYAYEDIDGFAAGYIAFDYNLFNAAGTNLFDFGPPYVDLAAFQTAQPTFNANAVEGDPLFLSPSDLHVVGSLADEAAQVIAGITEDIDGDTRAAMPDIGADEYTPPSCALPIVVGTSAITSDQATATWNQSTGTGYVVQWDTAGFTPVTSFAGLTSSSVTWVLITTVTDTSVIIDELNPGATPNGTGASLMPETEYEWYVMSFCGGVVSPNSAANSFTTACAAYTAPYTQNFDATTAPAVDRCWTILEEFTNTTSEYIRTYNGNFPGPANSAPNSLRFANSSGTNATGQLIAVSPEFSDFGSDKRIRFMLYDDDQTSDLIVGTMSDPGNSATFTPYDTIFAADVADDTWVEQTIQFDSYVGTDKYVALRHGANGTFDDLAIDDFIYELTPSCPKPIDLTASMVDHQSAVLSWNSVGTTDFFIEYGAPGFTPGSGTSMLVNTNPFTLTGLSASTTYQWFVTDSCAVADVSIISNAAFFTTTCTPFTAPYTQNFDATTAPAYDQCWSELEEFANTGFEDVDANAGTFPAAPFSAPNCIRMNNSSGLYPANGQMIFISPQFSDFASDKRIRFMLYDDDFVNDMIIGTMSDPANSATFTPFDTIFGADMGDDVWEEHTIPFTSYVGTDKYVAFLFGANGTFDDLLLDNFVYELTPSCPAPLSQTETNITPNSADLGWTSTASDYIIEWGPTGFTQGTGTIVTTSSNPFSLTGLTSNTGYDWYVMDICVAGADSSLWSTVSTFWTTCTSYTAPYSQNFDGTTDPDFDACWTGLEEFANTNFETIEAESGTFPAAAFSAPNSIRMSNSSGLYPANGQMIFVSPQFTDLSNNKRIRFMLYDDDFNSNLIVGTMSDPTNSATFTAYDTILAANVTNDTWELQTIEFTSYVGTDQYIGLMHGGGTSFDDLLIDDFVYDIIPTCADLTSSTGIPTSTTTGQISWTGGIASNYVVEWDTTGFTPGTGTVVTTTDTFLNVTGLVNGGIYDYYVSQICVMGVDTSYASTGMIDINVCEPTYSTGKTSGDLISEVSITGTTLSNNTGTAQVNPAYTYFTGAPNLTGTMQAGTSYDVIVTIGSFSNQDVAVWIDFNDDLIFDISERIGFTDNITPGFGSSTFTVSLPCNPTPGVHRMRVRCVWNAPGGATGIDPCANYTWGETEDYDVTITPPPPCPEIANLAFANLQPTSADLSWNTGCAETAWDIHVNTSATPPSGTPDVVAHTDSNYTAALSPSTTYFAHVRANCGGSTSGWSTVTFTTPGLPLTTFVWNGAVDNDWTNAGNWVGGTAPSGCADDVFISDVTNMPIVTGAFTCGDLTTDANSDIEVQLTGSINVCGNANFGGGFTGIGAGAIYLTGAGGGSTIVTTGATNISNIVLEADYSVTSGELGITNSLVLDSGDLTNAGGSVVLRSSATGTAYLDDFTVTPAGTYTGDITVESFVTPGSGLGQRFFGSAVVAGAIDDLDQTYATGYPSGQVIPDVCNVSLAMGSPYSNMFEWHEDATFASGCEQEGWFAIDDATAMTPARGYSGWMNDGTVISATGAPSTGAISYVTTGTSGTGPVAADGWHLLSNPYPSPITVAAYTSSGFTSPQFYDGSSAAFYGTFTPAVLAGNFASMQGFFAESTGAGTVSVTNADRVASNAVAFVSSSTIFDQMLTVNVLGNGFGDKTYLYYSNDNTVTTGFDNFGDCKKRNSNLGQPTIYTNLGTERMALNGYPETSIGESIPLGVDHGADGNFELSFEGMTNFPANTTIYVEDMQAGVYHNIADGNYAYAALATDNSDRFMIHFVLPVELATVNVNCAGDLGKIELVSTTGIVNRDYVIAEATNTVATGALSTLNESVASGTYEVTINDEYGGNQVYTVTVGEDEAIEAAYTVSSINVQVGEVVSFDNTTMNTTTVEWTIADLATVTGVNNATYTFDEVGTYEISLMVSNDDCSDVKTFEVNVSNKTTSTTTLSADNLIKVYSNEDVVTISFENDFNANAKVEIQNAIGQKVFAGTVRAEGTQTINIEEVTTGYYFVSVEVEGERLSSKIFLTKK